MAWSLVETCSCHSYTHPTQPVLAEHTCPMATNVAANLGEIGAKKPQMLGI